MSIIFMVTKSIPVISKADKYEGRSRVKSPQAGGENIINQNKNTPEIHTPAPLFQLFISRI